MMPTVIKIEFNSAGFAAALKDPKTLTAVTAIAHRIAAAAGEGFGVKSSIWCNRARAAVIAATPAARRAEAADKVLTSAIGAGHG